MEEINVEELKVKMDNNEDFHLIDVRESYEYEESNNGGQLIPLGNLAQHLDELEEWKEEEIILICRSGARSGRAQQFLQDHGFSYVYNVTGGMLAWQEMEDEG